MSGRHAYLIQAHGNFEQLKVLLSLLDDSRNDIFVHVDAKARGFERSAFDGVCTAASLVFLEHPINVRWGGPSQIWSELMLLEEALAAGEHSYYHLLSGADLPIKTQDEIHSFFEANEGREFVLFWKKKNSTASRWLYSPFAEYGSRFAGNLVNNIFKGVQLLFGRHPHPEVDFRYGANWFSITEDLARYVVSRKDWIRKVFSHTCNCDEVFLQTLVWNSPFLAKCYDPAEYDSRMDSVSNMRFVDWSRGGHVRHPWVFRSDDFDLLMSRPQLFARKFDINVDSQVIRRIADAIGR